MEEQISQRKISPKSNIKQEAMENLNCPDGGTQYIDIHVYNNALKLISIEKNLVWYEQNANIEDKIKYISTNRGIFFNHFNQSREIKPLRCKQEITKC